MTVHTVTDATFQQEVLESDKPTFVQYWAEWCAPCRRVMPIIDQIAAEHPDNMKFTRVNVDENPATTMQSRITGIPAMKIFKDGVEVLDYVGAAPQRVLENVFSEYL